MATALLYSIRRSELDSDLRTVIHSTCELANFQLHHLSSILFRVVNASNFRGLPDHKVTGYETGFVSINYFMSTSRLLITLPPFCNRAK